MYRAARQAVAIGGKISGAGGGGFLLLYCPLEFQDDVRKTLAPLRELPFSLERDGSKAIFIGGEGRAAQARFSRQCCSR
jgi:D-glycero-alpha-D-manno-heptose-7-phosphate kinase